MTNVNETFNILCDKIYNQKQNTLTEKAEKINDKLILRVPQFNEYDLIVKFNYNINQLKMIAKSYKLKMSGNKQQLVSKIYSFLFLSNLAVKIQKLVRGHLQRFYNRSHGPALKDRSLCTNNFDFLSMDQLTDIPKEQFFSYRDEDGFIYGFDLLSIYNLIYKCDGIIKNPFNNKPIEKKVIDDFRILIRLSRLFKIDIITEIADVTKEVSNKKSIELKALSTFQNIDALGNYSNAEWFLTLNREQLFRFIEELSEIWNFRAALTSQVKKNICPPYGNPFLNSRMPALNVLRQNPNLDDIRNIILNVIKQFVETGIDKDNKCLGAFYVLGALTLVNNDAATSLPWLYQTVYYM
jgi:hypothetical protein